MSRWVDNGAPRPPPPAIGISALMASFDSIRLDRDTALADLGMMPPWYRPFARRRWRHERQCIFDTALICTELLAGRVARQRPEVVR